MFHLNAARRKRLIWIVLILLALGISIIFALLALKKNINLYFTPTQLKQTNQPPLGTMIRIGGLVQKGSVHYIKDQQPHVQFILTDGYEGIPVDFVGILPDLFREGQGIVAQGSWDPAYGLKAHEVLAKHDERYMPKEVAQAIAQAKQEKK